MAYMIGILLAFAVSTFAKFSGFDRDRAFYPTMTVVIASYYALFTVMSRSTNALLAETMVLIAMTAMAVVGFKFNPWLIVFSLAAHGVFDWLHSLIVSNPGVPEWWPAFCLAFDFAIAGVRAWQLTRSCQAARCNSDHQPSRGNVSAKKSANARTLAVR